jgi:hypothetical protein
MNGASGTLEPRRSPGSVRRRGALVALLVSAAMTYSLAVFGPPFYTKGEPREAVVVQRIVRHGEILLPRRLEHELPTKPPLFHWLGAAASVAAGRIDEATVRLPSLLASLLALALTVTAGYRLFGTTAGLTAGIVLATSQQWIASSVTARVDMTLAAAITLAMLAFLHAFESGRRPVPWLFYVGCSLGVLAKGPVGCILPILTVGIFLALARERDYARRLRPLLGAAILAVPLVWYVLASRSGGPAFVGNVFAENVLRMIDADAENLGHRRGPLYYLPALLAGMLPWSPLLLPAVHELWRRRSASTDTRRLFLVAWVGVTVAFYSLAESKRPVYLLSCYPALALLVGDWLARRFETAQAGTPSDGRSWIAGMVALLILLPVALVALQACGVPTFPVFGGFLSAGDRANLSAVTSSLATRPITVGAWTAITSSLTVMLALAIRHGAWRRAFGSMALLVAATVMITAPTFFRDLAETQSIASFVAEAVDRAPEAEALYYYSSTSAHSELSFFRAFEYAATFYARRPLRVVDDPHSAGIDDRLLFLAAEPSFVELERRATTEKTDGVRYRAVARYTYNDNPRRVPVVLVEGIRH